SQRRGLHNPLGRDTIQAERVSPSEHASTWQSRCTPRTDLCPSLDRTVNGVVSTTLWVETPFRLSGSAPLNTLPLGSGGALLAPIYAPPLTGQSTAWSPQPFG